MIHMRVGRTYRARNGDAIGPIRSATDDNEFYPYRASGGKYGTLYYRNDGTCNEGMSDYCSDQYDLIAEWTDGPVRTVTRREVVGGSYGRVSVRSASPEQGFATIGLTNQNGYCQDHQYVSAAELKAAAAVLLELAGALSDGE